MARLEQILIWNDAVTMENAAEDGTTVSNLLESPVNFHDSHGSFGATTMTRRNDLFGHVEEARTLAKFKSYNSLNRRVDTALAGHRGGLMSAGPNYSPNDNDSGGDWTRLQSGRDGAPELASASGELLRMRTLNPNWEVGNVGSSLRKQATSHRVSRKSGGTLADLAGPTHEPETGGLEHNIADLKVSDASGESDGSANVTDTYEKEEMKLLKNMDFGEEFERKLQKEITMSLRTKPGQPQESVDTLEGSNLSTPENSDDER